MIDAPTITSLIDGARQWLERTDPPLIAVQLGSALLLGLIVYAVLSSGARGLRRRTDRTENPLARFFWRGAGWTARLANPLLALAAASVVFTPPASAMNDAMTALLFDSHAVSLGALSLPEATGMISSVTAYVRRWIAETDLTLLSIEIGGALLIAIVVYAALAIGLKAIGRRLQKVPNPIIVSLGRMIGKTSGLFMLVAAVAAGSIGLELPDSVRTVIRSLFIIAFVLQTAIWASEALAAWLERVGSESAADHRALSSARAIIGTLMKVALWSVAALLVLDNLGFDVTALIAGLGIGGIAVGLAAQKIIGDLFASLAIVLDKPFEYGDFIIAGQQMGTVERIGLKTTRIRALSGEQIVIANADLLDSRIQNYKRMAERRVVFSVGVTYGTPLEKLQRIPKMIAEAINAQDKARFDRSHFMAYGDSSLNFETVYYVLSREYSIYADTHQAILLEIYRRFADEGIDFAFPTQTLHIESVPPGLIAGGPGAGPEPGSAS